MRLKCNPVCEVLRRVASREKLALSARLRESRRAPRIKKSAKLRRTVKRTVEMLKQSNLICIIQRYTVWKKLGVLDQIVALLEVAEQDAATAFARETEEVVS